jgi:steroid delta-isomerase-like uncharacterized protein
MAERSTLEKVADLPARYFAAWNGRDADAATALLADDFVWEAPSLPVPMSTLDDAIRFFERSWVSFPDLQFELLGAPMLGGGCVSQAWCATGTHQGEGMPAGVPGTGRPIEVRGIDVFTVDRDGRAARVHTFYDAMTLAAQLGLVPAAQ